MKFRNEEQYIKAHPPHLHPNQTQVMQTQIRKKQKMKKKTRNVLFNINYVQRQVAPTSRVVIKQNHIGFNKLHGSC